MKKKMIEEKMDVFVHLECRIFEKNEKNEKANYIHIRSQDNHSRM